MTQNSILYAESHGRVLKIVTDSEELETYDKLAHFAFQLDKRFLQCHKSYLVNMEYVKRYCGDSFQMANEQLIPISQSRHKEVKEHFLSYMSGEAEGRQSGL